MSLPESIMLEPLNKVFTAQRVARLMGTAKGELEDIQTPE